MFLSPFDNKNALCIIAPVYEVTIKKEFSAAHMLNEIGGKCEALHGHNFLVEVSVLASDLGAGGLLVDFRDLKSWTAEVLQELDHKCLNDLPFFTGANPSAENVARYIFDRIAGKLQGETVRVSRVTVWESENARVTYTGADD